MATQITNQAQLTYRYCGRAGSAFSNIASTTLQGPLTLEKNALVDRYNGEDDITYIISFTNTANSTMTDVVITDNLGSYTVPESLVIATPLDFIGPAALYVGGSFVSYLNGIVGPNSVSFNLGSVGSGENAMVIYRARVNDYVLPSPVGSITNTAVVTADGIAETATASATIDFGNFADVSIIKTMTPDPVSTGELITYNFSLYNYGNTPANNVVLTDQFSPAPTISSVTINGNPVPPFEYNYIGGELTLPASDRLQITIPPASYSQDARGFVTKIPGVVTVTVTGTVL